MEDIKDIWEDVMRSSDEFLPPDTTNLWLQSSDPLSLEDGVLTIDVPNDFFKEYIEQNILEPLIGFLKKKGYAEGAAVHLNKDARQPEPTPPPQEYERRQSTKNGLNPNYIFDTFVVGKSNRVAHAASLAASERPGMDGYNPLFIWGGVGLGKTHLMHAIANRVEANIPGAKTLYVTSESFMNDFISSVKDRQPERLHERYRKLDVLLVDDIQFIGRGSGTKEEFFNVFNVLRDKGKQIVISSDKPPKELDNIDERLTSRFGSGLVVDIQPPDFETRTAILQKKSEMKGYDVPEDVIKFIAEKIPSNIRELEGTLNRITTYSITTNEPMTVENMYEWLKHDLKRGDGVSVDYIQQLAAESFGVTIEDLASQKRTAGVALARQVAMYIACEKMEGSLQVIGSAFQRDHATVIHARNKIEKMIKDDPRIKKVVDNIMDKL